MPIFTDYDYYANQLWIGARYMESITLFIAFFFLGTGKRIIPKIVLTVYSVCTTVIVLSIFYWKIFPICFVDGVGLTEFKKVSEYVICLILIVSIVLLNKNRCRFETRIFYILFLSMVCTILSELAFTFYIDNYGLSNIIGHYFKLFSFFLIYKAIIETGIQNPYEMIFKELQSTNTNLSKEIEARIKVEEEREKLISNLKTALAEVKKLSGLIPICSHCKKIRDDKGYWNQIEDYIHKHSEAKFSHSICQECVKIYYPDYDIYDPT